MAWLFLLHLLLLLVHPEVGKLGVGEWCHWSLRGGGWHDGHVWHSLTCSRHLNSHCVLTGVLLTAVVGVLAAQEAPCFEQPGCKLTELVDEGKAGEADEKPEVSTDVGHRVRQPVRYQLLLPGIFLIYRNQKIKRLTVQKSSAS